MHGASGARQIRSLRISTCASRAHGIKECDEFLTGELFLPSRTSNQYLARYWFAVSYGKNSSPVKKFIDEFLIIAAYCYLP
jgi:hypothetical protein